MRYPALRSVLTLLAAAGVWAGCGLHERASETPAGETAASAATTPADRAADEQAIRAMETRWRDVVRRRDTAAVARFYAQDGIYTPNQSPPIRGRDAVSARWAREFGDPAVDFALERTPLRIEVAGSGELATEVGTYVVRMTFPKDGRVEAGGTYSTAWRKAGGEWQIASYMWNRDSDKEWRAPR